MKTQVDDDLFIFIICQKMGWTYEQYMDNPVWFNQMAELFIKNDKQ